MHLRRTRLGTAWRATIWSTSALSSCSPFLKFSSPSSYQMEGAGKKGLQAAASKQQRVTPHEGGAQHPPQERARVDVDAGAPKKGNYSFCENWLSAEPKKLSACPWAFQPDQPHPHPHPHPQNPRP